MNPFTYYGGTRVRDGIVRPLKATCFEELVRRYFDSPVPIALDRAEFLALPKSERDIVKDVPYVTPCSFKEGTTKRCDANADKMVLACIDLDPPDIDFGGTDYVSDFFHAPETIGAALHPLPFIAYCTANHTPERPRLRILVPVEPCDPSMHRRVIQHLVKLLGLPADFSGSRESQVISQPAYRPVSFQDDDNSVSCLLAARVNGDPLEAHQTALETVADPKRVYAAHGLDDPGLDFLPTYGLTVEEIREPLFAISPDCGYKQWTEVASAMRHQFRTEEEAREAYNLFDEWSATGVKYKGEKDTFAKWRSFRPDPTGKNPITIRTVFHYAKLSGWKQEQAVDDISAKLEAWIEEQTDPKLLGKEGPARIAAFPFRDAIIESRLLDSFRNKLKALGKPITTATANKALKQAKTKVRIENDRKEVPGWLRPWVFVATTGEFISKASGVRLTPTNFNLAYSLRLMSDEPDNEMAKLGLPLLNPDKFALNVQAIDRVEAVLYDPRPETPLIFDYKGVKYLNEYRADTLPIEDPERAEWTMGVFRRMLANVFGSEAELALWFLAYMVQHPGEKIRWCICVQSAQGAGKSMLAAMMAAVLGTQNVIAVEPRHFKAGWNEWAYGKQFVVFEEIHVAGEARAAIMDLLKTLISETELTINQKNRDARTILNFANCIAFTNHMDALYLEESDRRYAVVRSPIQTKADVDRINATGIFDEAAEIVRDHGGALRHALLNYEIPSSFDPNVAPRTKARDEMVEASKNRLQIAIEELIEGDNPLIADDVIMATEVIRMTAEESRNNHKPSHFLAMLGYERYEAGRRYTVNGIRSAIWIHRDRYEPTIAPAEELLAMRAEKRMDDL